MERDWPIVIVRQALKSKCALFWWLLIRIGWFGSRDQPYSLLRVLGISFIYVRSTRLNSHASWMKIPKMFGTRV